jgi:hypothetical protein
MRSDTDIRVKGMRALIDALGPVDSARFVSLALREPFDYVKWRNEEFADESLESLIEKIRIFEKDREAKEFAS